MRFVALTSFVQTEKSFFRLGSLVGSASLSQIEINVFSN